MAAPTLHRSRIEHIEVKHVVHVTDNDCIIATAHDTETKKLKIYLINREGKLFRREGVNGVWLDERRQSICKIVLKALKDTSTPRYSTNSVPALV